MEPQQHNKLSNSPAHQPPSLPPFLLLQIFDWILMHLGHCIYYCGFLSLSLSLSLSHTPPRSPPRPLSLALLLPRAAHLFSLAPHPPSVEQKKRKPPDEREGASISPLPIPLDSSSQGASLQTLNLPTLPRRPLSAAARRPHSLSLVSQQSPHPPLHPLLSPSPRPPPPSSVSLSPPPSPSPSLHPLSLPPPPHLSLSLPLLSTLSPPPPLSLSLLLCAWFCYSGSEQKAMSSCVITWVENNALWVTRHLIKELFSTCAKNTVPGRCVILPRFRIEGLVELHGCHHHQSKGAHHLKVRKHHV